MARLSYPLEYYRISSYYSYRPLSREQMEQQYDKMRNRALKNLDRIERSEFASDNFYKQYYGRFEAEASQLSERELAFSLQDLAYFTSSKRSSYSGAREMRREAVRSMKRAGYDFVTYNNYGEFADFMELVKTAYTEHIYDSKTIVEWYAQHKESLTPGELLEDFSAWVSKNEKNTKRRRSR